MFIGKITRPDFDSGDKPVTLKATATKGNASKSISFDIFIKRLGITDGQAVVKDLASIVLPSETKVNLTLPLKGDNGTTISWVTNDASHITNTGLVVRPSDDEGDVTVTLTATVTKGEETDTKEFEIKVIAWNTEDEVEDAKSQIVWSLISGGNASINMVTTDLHFPEEVGRGVTVTWVSSNKSFCGDDGKITRPTYTQGPVILNVTARLEKDGVTNSVTISGIRLEPAGITNAEIAIDASNKLDSSLFIGSNISLSQVVTNMMLPTTINDALSAYCSIKWELVDEGGSLTTSQYVTLTPKGNDVECIVVRPSSGDSNYIGQLKATISATDPSGGTTGTAEKLFRMIVLAEGVNP